jgi:hypothetical protein
LTRNGRNSVNYPNRNEHPPPIFHPHSTNDRVSGTDTSLSLDAIGRGADNDDGIPPEPSPLTVDTGIAYFYDNLENDHHL